MTALNVRHALLHALRRLSILMKDFKKQHRDKKRRLEMSTYECICIACGYSYLTMSPATESLDHKKCPNCDSTDVVKKKHAGMFEFTGGG